MALLNIDTIIQETIRYLKETPVGCGIEIMSYKRNRTLAIIVEDSNQFRIIEKGYANEEEQVALEELPKNLKKRIKREFPRSRKLRLVKFTDIEELERIHQKI